ncbi:hypothetical protein PUN28_014970 [Cardiocondyla obscurior]|uniref:Uncharacterized protein n=1 Tax=Cardiocondyla obscurior TaxID=286306 RepID=A0AAW2F0R3_9HYME
MRDDITSLITHRNRLAISKVIRPIKVAGEIIAGEIKPALRKGLNKLRLNRLRAFGIDNSRAFSSRSSVQRSAGNASRSASGARRSPIVHTGRVVICLSQVSTLDHAIPNHFAFTRNAWRPRNACTAFILLNDCAVTKTTARGTQ